MLFLQYFKGMLFWIQSISGISNTSLFDFQWCLVKFRLDFCGPHTRLVACSQPRFVYGDTQCYTCSTENELLIRIKLYLCCCFCLRWRCCDDDCCDKRFLVIMMMMTTGMTTFLNNIITSCDNNGDSDDNYTTFITRFILVEVIYPSHQPP